VKIRYCGVDENKMLMRMCELQRDEARVNQKNYPSEKLHNFHSSPDIISVYRSSKEE